MVKPKKEIKYPLDDGIGFISIVDRMKEDTALKVVNSARISYSNKKSRFDNKDQKLTQFLIRNGHMSPFRHTYYTFHIKAPLVTLRQWIKYQIGSTWRDYEVNKQSVSLEVFDIVLDTDKGTSWNEISGRYVKLKPEFYIPSIMRSNVKHGNKQASEELPNNFDHASEKLRMYQECDEAYKRYEERLEAGIAKEIARMMLPQNIYSEIYWTPSLQAILFFLEQRLNDDSQYEIRKYAEAIYELLKKDFNRLGIVREDLSG